MKILGTFITEWELGAKECNILLSSQHSIQTAVSRLVEISDYYGFDGWFINIENPLQPSIEKVGKMKEFVELLTKEMHSKQQGNR